MYYKNATRNTATISSAQKHLVIRILQEMFPIANKTFIGVMQGNCHKTFSVKYIIGNLDYFVGNPSVYFTGNILKPLKGRSQENTAVLNDIYLDLDTNHNDNSSFVSPENAYWQVLDLINKNTVPKPSMVLNTGRGLQLHWFIEPIAVTKSRIELWKKIEMSLSKLFLAYHSDNTVALDYARLLRFPYSVNAKNGCVTDVLDFDGERYSIDYLAEKVLGDKNCCSKEKQASEKQQRYINDICQVLQLNNPCVTMYKEADLFIKKHLDNFEESRPKKRIPNKRKYSCPKVGDPYSATLEALNATAIEKYVKDHPHNNHCRETLLFLYRLAMLHALDDEKKAWEKVCTLNNMYNEPFDENKLKKLTNSAVVYYRTDDTHWYGPNAIEDKVVGDNDCDSILPYFLKATKKRNQKEYNKKYYERKLEENCKEKKSVLIGKRREKIKSLRSLGYTYAEISSLLGISKKTIQRDVASISKESEKRFEDKNSSSNLLYITSGISPKGGLPVSAEAMQGTFIANVSTSETFSNVVTDDEDEEDIAIMEEIKEQKGLTKQDLKEAYSRLVTTTNKLSAETNDSYESALRLFDEMIYTYESLDVLDPILVEKHEKVGTFGKTFIYFTRERKKKQHLILSYLQDEFKTNTSNCFDDLKQLFYDLIKQHKKLKNIEDYYVKQRVRSRLQIMNSIKVYKAKNELIKINNLRKTTNDYAVINAIDKFFYWYNKYKNEYKTDRFVVNQNEFTGKELASKMFFNASVSNIKDAAEKVRRGAFVKDILLEFFKEKEVE